MTNFLGLMKISASITWSSRIILCILSPSSKRTC